MMYLDRDEMMDIVYNVSYTNEETGEVEVDTDMVVDDLVYKWGFSDMQASFVIKQMKNAGIL